MSEFFEKMKRISVEEARIRSLVSLRTHEDLTAGIPSQMNFAMLYPTMMMLDKAGNIIDEMTTYEFCIKVEQWPDVKSALIRANLWHGNKNWFDDPNLKTI
jgi:hypothetical protein